MQSQLDARDLNPFHSMDPHKLTELSTIYDLIYDLNSWTWPLWALCSDWDSC